MIKNPLSAQLGQQLNNAQSSLDLNSLNKLKQQARQDDPAALRAVAEQFESLFLNMLLKNMRSANNLIGGEDNPFNSSDVQFYQGMLDQELSLKLAGGRGIGLADVLVRQLSRGQTAIPPAAAETPAVELQPGESVEQAQFEALRRRFDQALDRTAQAAVDALLGNSQALAAVAGPDELLPANLAGTEPVAPPVSPTLEHQSLERQLLERARLERNQAVAKPEAVPGGARSTSGREQLEPAPARFDTPESFINFLYPIAEKVAHELGVDPKVLVSQAALETGWGKHLVRRVDGSSSHNLFNIKADQRWAGERAVVGTLEYRDGVARREQAAFRVYDSFENSLRDYIDFLKASPRYQRALEQAQDPHAYVRELQDAGYATDPSYAEKISNIIDSPALAAALDQLKRS